MNGKWNINKINFIFSEMKKREILTITKIFQ